MLLPWTKDELAWLEAYDILDENVERGIIFLDSVDPSWYLKVPLKSLVMECGSSCICGWVFKGMMQEGYQYFVEHFQPEDGEGAIYGFSSDDDVQCMEWFMGNQWSMLAEIWTAKIEKRLANDGKLGI